MRYLIRKITSYFYRVSLGASRNQIYGEVSIRDNTNVTIIDTQDVFVQVVDLDTRGLAKQLDVISNDSEIGAPTDVVSFIMCSISCEAADNANKNAFEFQIQKNDGSVALDNLIGIRSVSGPAGEDKMSVSLSGIVKVSKGDTIELWVRNRTSNRNILIRHCTLSAIRIA